MTHRRSFGGVLTIAVCLLSLGAGTACVAEQANLLVARGDRIAIAGDSITEQKLYTKFMEAYFKACVPQYALSVMQLGWSGEQASAFANRLAHDLLPWRPDVVTTCYGMNDGWYRPYTEETRKRYVEPMQKIVSDLNAAGAKVVIGSPGVVDPKNFDFPGEITAGEYNKTLTKLAEIAAELAANNAASYANINQTMAEVMAQTKAAFGEDYHIAGTDGIHPCDNGQLLMAYTFLRALGFDGAIATITIDMNGPVSASSGHTVIEQQSGKAVVESTRYPFCFYGPKGEACATIEMPDFIPFNDTLNRFMLVVENLKTDQARVTWGSSAKTFSREQLSAGVNLAAEFAENPFCQPFQEILHEVFQKQVYETVIIKQFISGCGQLTPYFADEPDVIDTMQSLSRRMLLKHEEFETKVRSAVEPVRHTIEITPL